MAQGVRGDVRAALTPRGGRTFATEVARTQRRRRQTVASLGPEESAILAAQRRRHAAQRDPRGRRARRCVRLGQQSRGPGRARAARARIRLGRVLTPPLGTSTSAVSGGAGSRACPSPPSCPRPHAGRSGRRQRSGRRSSRDLRSPSASAGDVAACSRTSHARRPARRPRSTPSAGGRRTSSPAEVHRRRARGRRGVGPLTQRAPVDQAHVEAVEQEALGRPGRPWQMPRVSASPGGMAATASTASRTAPRTSSSIARCRRVRVDPRELPGTVGASPERGAVGDGERATDRPGRRPGPRRSARRPSARA